MLRGCAAVAKQGKRTRRIRRTRLRSRTVEKHEGYEKGKRERFERRVSPSARCFVRGGEKEGRRGGVRRGDKNSPNPSLITMPAKSEILTAVAPRHIALKRGEQSKARRKRERERVGEKEGVRSPKKLDSFLRDQRQRRRASVLREVSDKERAPH